MVDARFAAPPEDFELLQRDPSNAKGKGRLEKSAKPVVKKNRKQQWQQLEHSESGSDSEHDLYDEVLNGPIPSTSYSAAGPQEVNGQGEEDENDDGVDGQVDGEQDEPLNSIPKVLQLDNVEDFNKKVDKTGLIYLSRIPPGMGPSKVKHILSNYGEIGRIYLVAADDEKRKHSDTNHNSKKKIDHKHRPHKFIEGWVEFMDKRVARSTADMLNARPIGDVAMSKGSKKNGGTRKWQDDVWTLKYLPRFKWNMLSEQVAIEAATRAALLRNELAQSKKEQAEYLRQVERAKNYDKSQEKKRAREERRGDDAGHVSQQDKPLKKAKKERSFEQKTVVTPRGQNGVMDAKLGSVLDSLF